MNGCFDLQLTCILFPIILLNNILLLSSSVIYSSEQTSKVLKKPLLTEGGLVSEVLLLADLQVLEVFMMKNTVGVV